MTRSAFSGPDYRAELRHAVGHDVLPGGEPVEVRPVPGLFITGIPHVPQTVDANTADALVESGAFRIPPAKEG